MAEGRRDELIAAARELLEEQGEAALSMRRLADRIGMRPSSIYKHVPDKATLEVPTGGPGAGADGARLPGVGARAPTPLPPDDRSPLPRERLPSGLEDRAAEPLFAALGDQNHARAAWAAMVRAFAERGAITPKRA